MFNRKSSGILGRPVESRAMTTCLWTLRKPLQAVILTALRYFTVGRHPRACGEPVFQSADVQSQKLWNTGSPGREPGDDDLSVDAAQTSAGRHPDCTALLHCRPSSPRMRGTSIPERRCSIAKSLEYWVAMHRAGR